MLPSWNLRCLIADNALMLREEMHEDSQTFQACRPSASQACDCLKTGSDVADWVHGPSSLSEPAWACAHASSRSGMHDGKPGPGCLLPIGPVLQSSG